MKKNQAEVAKEILDPASDRPIVERPEWVDWRQIENRDLSGHDKAMGQRYIRHLEHNLSVTEKALSDARDRLEAIYEQHGPDIENVRE